MKRMWAAVVTYTLVLAVAVPLLTISAQPSSPDRVDAVNLSVSGAASQLVAVRGLRQNIQFFWWDRFDGLTTALYYGGRWSPSRVAPIMVPRLEMIDRRETWVSYPIKVMPSITSDRRGQAHALWLGEKDKETDLVPLLYSRLAVGTTTWESPRTVIDSASAAAIGTGARGRLHLVYVRPTDSPTMPAGLYHIRSADGGATWSEARPVNVSRYIRLISPGKAHLEVSADELGNVFVVWDDPHTDEAVFVRSANGGYTWTEPATVYAPDPGARGARLLAPGGGILMFLWEAARGSGLGGLYQRRSLDEGQTWHDARRVLTALTLRSRTISLSPMSDGAVLLSAPSATGAIALAAWDRTLALEGEVTGWSEPHLLYPQSTEGDATIAVSGGNWQTSVIGDWLVFAGVGRDGEIWAGRVSVDALPWRHTEPQSWSDGERVEAAEDSSWSVPVNVSRSAAASAPTVIAGLGQTCQAFWWDRFDGLTTTYYDGTSWYRSLAAPIAVSEFVDGDLIARSVDSMPEILGDGQGHAYAFWLGEKRRGVEQRPLLFSVLSIGNAAWSEPRAVENAVHTWQVAADSYGALHVVFVRTSNTLERPAGIYYANLEPEKQVFSSPVPIYESVYFRLLSTAAVHLAVATDDVGGVHVSWNDPRSLEGIYAASRDRGESWSEPQVVGSAGLRPQTVRFAMAGTVILRVWEAGRPTPRGSVFEQLSTDHGLTWSDASAAFGTLDLRGRNVSFGASTERGVLAISGSGTDVLSLLSRDVQTAPIADQVWSEVKQLSFSFNDPHSTRAVYLTSLRATQVNDALVVVGQGSDSNVWAIHGREDALEWIAAPPDSWTEPVVVWRGPSEPDVPAVASDSVGRLHVVWGVDDASRSTSTVYHARLDANGWRRPRKVLVPFEGSSALPALSLEEGLIHVAVTNRETGGVYYGRSQTGDAIGIGGFGDLLNVPWPSVAPLVSSRPAIHVDLSGVLHVAYPIPVNEGRGIYHARSEDQGGTWKLTGCVFDAQAADWTMVDRPSLAVDVDNTIHLVWVRRGLQPDLVPVSIHHVSSHDGGRSWSEPMLVAEGAYDFPQVLISAPGVVHVVWADSRGPSGWSHRWSGDGGKTWAVSSRVPGLGIVDAPIGVASDGEGKVHAVGAEPGGELGPRLVHVQWDPTQEQWTKPETISLRWPVRSVSGTSVALRPELGQLDVVMRGSILDDGGHTSQCLLHMRRAIAPVVVDLMRLVTPRPTPTATITPTPVPTPTPRPRIDPSRPGWGPPVVKVGPVSLPLAAIAGLVLAAVLVGVAVAFQGPTKRRER